MTIYLADSRSATGRTLWLEHRFGRMMVDRWPRPYAGQPWAMDNGAFRDWRQGRVGEYRRFERRLQRLQLRLALGLIAPPQFIVTPDLPGRGNASLAFSSHWLRCRTPEPESRATPTTWYLATQDGARIETARALLPEFDGLFLGGSDDHKEDAAVWAALARTAGLPVHYGRASSPRHVERARSIGADSLDTAWPLLGPRHLTAFLTALER